MSSNTIQNEKIQREHMGGMPYSNNSYIENDVDAVKQKIEKRKQKQKRQKVVLFGLLGLVVVFALLFGYSQYKLYVLSKEETIVTSNISDQAAESAIINASSTPEQVINALGKHILLPTGTPQIAQIQDITKLKESQAFFKDAQNGDIVVVYETMIYIYRPDKDILIATSDISGVGQAKP
jgi:cell division protein FtsL